MNLLFTIFLITACVKNSHQTKLSRNCTNLDNKQNICDVGHNEQNKRTNEAIKTEDYVAIKQGNPIKAPVRGNLVFGGNLFHRSDFPIPKHIKLYKKQPLHHEESLDKYKLKENRPIERFALFNVFRLVKEVGKLISRLPKILPQRRPSKPKPPKTTKKPKTKKTKRTTTTTTTTTSTTEGNTYNIDTDIEINIHGETEKNDTEIVQNVLDEVIDYYSKAVNNQNNENSRGKLIFNNIKVNRKPGKNGKPGEKWNIGDVEISFDTEGDNDEALSEFENGPVVIHLTKNNHKYYIDTVKDKKGSRRVVVTGKPNDTI